MNVHTYKTKGGKDLILTFLDDLSKIESVEGYRILETLEKEGLQGLITRRLQGKLWEIKFYRHNRIMYVVVDKDNIYLLHACKKQKGKAEHFELETALQRMKEL